MYRLLFLLLLSSLSWGATTCPELPQKVLVLDLKSGWWDGDGGDFHVSLLNKVTKDCPTLSVEYHLVFAGSQNTVTFPGAVKHPFNIAQFPLEKPSSYQQIWILSGSERDGADIKINSEKGRAIEKILKESNANLFLAASMGFVDLGNHFINVLGGTGRFETNEKELQFASQQVFSIESVLEPTLMTNHPVFQGVTKLPERLKLSVGSVESDGISGTGSVLGAIAKTPEGKIVVASGGIGSRKIVMDAGVHRFYAVFAAEQNDSYQYLLNLFKYLSH